MLKLNKIFALMLSLAITLPFISIAVTVTDTQAGITYTADDTNIAAGATTTNYDGITQGTDVIIPASVNIGGIDYAVTTLGESSFQYKGLTSVVIPSSVTTIAAYALSMNPQLTTINIPNSVTSIGYAAFAASGLTSLTIPDSITVISDSAFSMNRLTTLTIPNSVTTIGSRAFENSRLTTLTIPDSVTSIGATAFAGNLLEHITIPDSITSIAKSTFSSNQLTSISLPDTITEIGSAAFYHNPLTNINIPTSVTSIGDFAFYYNQLTTVTIPANVDTIGDNAFDENPTFTDAWFTGDAPAIATAGAAGSFGSSTAKTLHYNCSANGFSPTPWQGYNTQSYCNVAFDSQGGGAVAAEKVTAGEPATPPTEPTYSGYTFGGWFIDAAGTTPYNFTTPVTSNITLYAKWTRSSSSSNDVSSIPSTSFWALTVLMGITLLLGCVLLYQNLQSHRNN